MKAVPFRTLENAVISTNAAFNRVVDSTCLFLLIGTVHWQGVYLDINIFTDTAARAAAGNFLRVPVLGGTAANEDDIFLLVQELLTTGISTPTISEMLSDVSTLVRFSIKTWKLGIQCLFGL